MPASIFPSASSFTFLFSITFITMFITFSDILNLLRLSIIKFYASISCFYLNLSMQYLYISTFYLPLYVYSNRYIAGHLFLLFPCGIISALLETVNCMLAGNVFPLYSVCYLFHYSRFLLEYTQLLRQYNQGGCVFFYNQNPRLPSWCGAC